MKLKLFGIFTFLFSIIYLTFSPGLYVKSAENLYLNISAVDTYASSVGLLTFSSASDSKVNVTSGTSGPAKIEIYSVSLDNILDSLTHDAKYYQLNSKFDVSKYNHLSDLNINVSNKDSDISLPLPESGLFFIRVVQGNLTATTFAVRSTFGSMAREAKDSLVVWTQDFKTKRSASGAKVSLYNLENGKSVIAQANSDDVGIASVPLSVSADVIVVESNLSFAIIPLNARFLNNAHGWSSFQPNKTSKKYFVFTDRPIYQPGDVVHFKAIARDDNDARYSLSQGSVLVAVGRGYDDSTFLYKNTLSFDVNGFVAGNYTLPKNITAGDYRVIINPKTITSEWGDYQSSDDSIYFKVENYRKPEYSLTTESTQMTVVRGDIVNVSVNGQYYSGQALAGAVVNYKIYSDQYGDYEYYYPSDNNTYYRAWNGSEVETGTVTLDKKGHGQVSISTNKNDSLGKHQVYFVEFTYADASGNQSLSGVNVLVRSGDYSLYRGDNSVYGGKVNQKIEFPFILKTNRDGVSSSQKVDLNIIRHRWEKYSDNNSKYSQYREVKDDLGTQSFRTDATGKVVFSYTPDKEGSYELITKMVDVRGNVITKSFYLWVSNLYSNYYGDYNNPSTLKITFDKSTYQVGDQAMVHISSDIPDRDVYLGVERAYQDRYQILHLNGSSIDVPLKIVDHDLPNVYLAAKSFGTSDLEGDVQNLTVDTTGKKIIYQLYTDKTTYAPGDEVTVNISAKDTSGNPVESNLALWAVDKSIYALADLNYGDIFQNFWNNRSDDTQQAYSLEDILTGSGAEKGGCFLPDTKILMADNTQRTIDSVKAGDEILTHLSPTSSKMVSTKVTATHSTSAPGYLIINNQLKITDNHLLLVNGRWSTARSIKIGDQLSGVGDQKITVLSLEYLQLPTKVYNLTTDIYHTFIAEGVYVHNEKSGGSRDNFADTAYWNASINTNSQGVAQIKFVLPDNLTTWVITTIGASVDTKVGQAFTEVKVSKDLVIRPALPNILGENDTITVSALVHNFTQVDSQTSVKLITDAGTLNSPASQKVSVAANDFSQVKWQIKVGAGNPSAKFEFKVTDDKGRSDGVIQTVPVRAPGFWSQKSDFKSDSAIFDLSVPKSSYDLSQSNLELNLSSSIVGSLPSAMKYLINYPYGCTEQTTSALVPKLVAQKYPQLFADALKVASKKETIDDGLTKLKQLQNGDGSWSWWWQGTKSEPFITAYVFRILNEARALGYSIDDYVYNQAREYLNGSYDQVNIESKIVKAYGLSFSPDAKLHHVITTDFSTLSDDFLAIAVYTNQAAGITDSTKSGVDALVARATITDTGAHWAAGSLDRFGSNEASTSFAIQALVKSNTHLDLVAKAVNYLMKNRYHDYWGSTYTTAQTIFAITDYNASFTDVEANFNYRVLAGNTVLASGKFSGLKATPVSLNLDLKKVAKSTQITIEKTGSGQIYSTLNQKWWIKDAKSPSLSQGVSITKTYTNDKGEEYNFVPGDLVRVNLSVTFNSQDTRSTGYALIEDHLPSGLVPVNTNLLNESTSGDSSYQTKQFLKDGVIIPIYYNNSSKVYSYMARVVNEGTFYSPPAYYTLMYYPEVMARSESSTFYVNSDVKVNPLVAIKQTASDIAQPKNQLMIFVYIGVAFGLIALIIRNLRAHKNPPPITPPQS